MTSPRAGRSAHSAWRVLAHFAPHLRRQRQLVATSLGALIAEVVLRLLEPWPLKLVFDRVIVPASAPGVLVRDAADASWWIAVAALLVVIFALIRAVAAYYATVGFALIGNRVLTEARAELYAHLQRLSIVFHSRSRSGDLVVRVIGDIGLLKDVTVTALLPLLGTLFVLGGMLLVMFWVEWRLALVAIGVVPFFALITVHRSRSIHEVAQQQRRREGTLAARTAESITAIRTVKALSLEAMFAELFAAQNNSSFKEGVKAKRLEASLERGVDVLIAIATAGVLGYGAFLAVRGRITPGDLIVFLAYLKSAFRPVRDFAKYSGRLARATAAGERILDVLERPADVADRPGALVIGRARGEISLEHVSFGYDPAHPVLAGIDLVIPAGHRVAIVGPSGSGKTTLMGLMLRLYDPSLGRVLLDGRDARDYTLESLRRQFSVVLQDTLLFAGSIRDNIAFGVPSADEETIGDAAAIAGATAFIEEMPEGYDTRVGERGVTLSTGQRQRIAIARAALRNAPILILDEPTAGLDEESEQIAVTALGRLAAGRTTILVTHDLQSAIPADLIAYVEGGRIVERGSHAALMARDGRYARTFRMQTETAHPGEAPTYAGQR